MKYITFTMLILLLASTAFSRDNKKAPFKGKLVENPVTVIFHRIDGSEITSFEGSSDWYLTKEASGKNKMKLPSFVKTSKPIKIVYKTMNNEEFSTFDLKNWVAHKNATTKPLAKKTNGSTLEIVKQPPFPINDEFRIDFRLSADSEVKLVITDMQGRVVNCTTTTMKNGNNHLELNVGKLWRGSYIYKISAGVSFYSGLFLKL